MSKLILPSWVKKHNFEYNSLDDISEETMSRIREGLKKFKTESPEISIVIPAYNEEKDLLRTLSSLCDIKTKYAVELLVANNNSTDRTQEILDRLEIRSVFVKDQGISHARQGGIEAAKGKIIVNADSDSIYPSTWVDTLAEKLSDPNISCVYGPYSFIPSPNSSRAALGMYEMVAESFFALKRINRECVNVMGFNFAYRREDALKVGGFNHNLNRKVTGRSEDGWMALCLQKVGSIYFINDNKARVWTSDRRLMADGSLGKAFSNRVKKEISRIGIYFKPSPKLEEQK